MTSQYCNYTEKATENNNNNNRNNNEIAVFKPYEKDGFHMVIL